jgi:hypothetical protein
MKFKIFGGLDCPDFLLSQIATLSVLPPVAVGELSAHIVQDLVENNTDGKAWNAVETAVVPLFPDTDQAALSFAMASCATKTLLVNVVRFQVELAKANDELTMLGMSKEQSDALTGPLTDHTTLTLLRNVQVGATPQQDDIGAVALMSTTRCNGGCLVVLMQCDGQTLMLSKEKGLALLGELIVARGVLQRAQVQ